MIRSSMNIINFINVPCCSFFMFCCFVCLAGNTIEKPLYDYCYVNDGKNDYILMAHGYIDKGFILWGIPCKSSTR